MQSNLGYEYLTKIFSSLPIHSTSLNYDLDFKAATWSLRTTYVLPCNFKIHHARQSYELDITAFEQSLSMVYDLELWACDMIFVCNTSSCHDNHLCHIIYKSQHRWPSYGQIQTGLCEIYAQSLSADCDIDLWPNNMVLVHDILFCHDDHNFVSNHFQIPPCVTKIWSWHEQASLEPMHKV